MDVRSFAPTAYGTQIRVLLRTAMLVFVITVVIGILNGLDVVDFGRDTILTHVHAGTIGWITLGVFAFTLWLMGGPESGHGRGVAALAVVSVPLYVLAFWTGNRVLMSIFGTAVLLAIYGMTVFAIRGYSRSSKGTPHLATMLALVTLSIGSTIGVLIQIGLATSTDLVPGDDPIGGHAGAQVVGYLILVGMALAEWRLAPGLERTKPATAQVVLLFVGGLLVSVGALAGSEALLGIFMPLELIAVVIFLVRLGPRAMRVGWGRRTDERHFGVMVPFLVANVALLLVLIGGVVSGKYEDFTLIPAWLVFAFDHAMFIGVMTNGLFALAMIAGRGRPSEWVYDIAFWGMNAGLIIFVVGLLADSAVIKRIGSPVMGASILAVVFVLWFGLGTATEEPAPTVTA